MQLWGNELSNDLGNSISFSWRGTEKESVLMIVELGLFEICGTEADLSRVRQFAVFSWKKPSNTWKLHLK